MQEPEWMAVLPLIILVGALAVEYRWRRKSRNISSKTEYEDAIETCRKVNPSLWPFDEPQD